MFTLKIWNLKPYHFASTPSPSTNAHQAAQSKAGSKERATISFFAWLPSLEPPQLDVPFHVTARIKHPSLRVKPLKPIQGPILQPLPMGLANDWMDDIRLYLMQTQHMRTTHVYHFPWIKDTEWHTKKTLQPPSAFSSFTNIDQYVKTQCWDPPSPQFDTFLFPIAGAEKPRPALLFFYREEAPKTHPKNTKKRGLQLQVAVRLYPFCGASWSTDI